MNTLGLVRFGFLEDPNHPNYRGPKTIPEDAPMQLIEDAPLVDAACVTRTGRQLYREDRFMRLPLVGPFMQILNRLAY